MLDDYKDLQKISYRVLKNTVSNNKSSHAYLFETNGYSKGLDFAISFAKYLLCPYHYTNSLKCNNCFQCEQIDTGSFGELKIIDSDGQWIKKEQLIDLKEEFSKKSINGKQKVYIINNADKLNVTSSNSLLKFLEEPEDNIVAILLVNNRFQLLNTILSRCQILSLNNIRNTDNMYEAIAEILYNDKTKIEEYKNDENNIEKVENIIKYIVYYEKNGFNKTYINIQKLLKSYNYDKIETFEIIINFYKDVINYKLNRKLDIFSSKEKDIKLVSELNDLDNLVSKVSLYIKLKETIKYNVNNNLLMDKLLIELGGLENDRSNRS